MDKTHSAKSPSGDLGVTVNGKSQELHKPVSLAELIALNNITQPDMVSVQLNGEFVYKEDYASITLKDGDEVDFLYFMGGGNL
ncbi:MAG: sulfur carrier protein ThiS [Dysgonamonadaceae bacterium]|jgi:sulfur carrier protein|nr:sulfur carrier protein ThiS [Dysgonamonadaceae bacterium]